VRAHAQTHRHTLQVIYILSHALQYIALDRQKSEKNY